MIVFAAKKWAFVGNKAETFVTLRVVFTPLHYIRMYGALSGITVEALDLLLDSKRVNFGRQQLLPLRAVPMLSDFGSESSAIQPNGGAFRVVIFFGQDFAKKNICSITPPLFLIRALTQLGAKGQGVLNPSITGMYRRVARKFSFGEGVRGGNLNYPPNSIFARILATSFCKITKT